jgi:hypothetical protein
MADSFYIPIALSREIERLANLDYGGNQSALVTEKLSTALGIPLPEEVLSTQEHELQTA